MDVGGVLGVGWDGGVSLEFLLVLGRDPAMPLRRLCQWCLFPLRLFWSCVWSIRWDSCSPTSRICTSPACSGACRTAIPSSLRNGIELARIA